MNRPNLRSSIDLGTNTCLMLVVSLEGGRENVHGDFATIVRLGQKVDGARALHPDAIERTLTCLRGYAAELKKLGGDPAETVCVATSQARDAQNGAEFFARVQKETGFRFKVISGDEEARLTFRGALLPGMDPARSAVIDIGGGSTEIVSIDGGRSIDVGSVRFTERFLKSDPVTDGEFWACQDAIDLELEVLKPWRAQSARGAQGLQLVAVAGTATTLAAWQLDLAKFEPGPIHELTLTRGDVHRLVEELKWRTVEERCALPAMERGRADVLLAGALVLWRAMEVLDFSDCRVSTRGLRYGVLLG